MTNLSKEPHDRLTRLCAVARDAVLADPEYDEETDKLLVSMDGQGMSGFYSSGYSGPRELVIVLLGHIRALATAGSQLN